MTQAPGLLSTDHPRAKRNSGVIETMVQSLAPEIVHAAIAPNFAAELPSASPTLHRAFDIDPQFADAGKDGGVDTTGGVLLSGYALKIDGSLPIDSKARVQHVLGLWNQGLGTSMYSVTALPNELKNASDEQLTQINSAARERLPHMISPAHRASLERSPTTFDNDQYVIFISANDVPAALRMYQYVAARAASKDDPILLETLVNSPEYGALLERSQCARDTLARRYADALGVKIHETPTLTSMHHVIMPSNALAHGTHQSPVPQNAARESRFYVVYNNASPAHEAHGGVIINHGIMGGHTVLHTADLSPWHQPGFLSLMPATSGEVYAGHTELEAVHRTQSERTKSAFSARVTWLSDLGPTFMHSSADEAYYSMLDPYTQRWLERLSPPHANSLQQRPYNLVTGQLPSVTTVYAPTELLAALARQEHAPTNILVALDHDIVCRMIRLWDTVVRARGYPSELAQVFENAYDLENTGDGFSALSLPSACTNPSHLHSTAVPLHYTDATQYYIEPGSGMYDRGARRLDQGDIDFLRRALAPEGGRNFQTRTVLTLDRGLIQMLTMEPVDDIKSASD